MNGLLRHTSNVHLGMSGRSSFWKFLGVVWGNIKGGYTFVTSGFRTTGSAVGGLIGKVKL